MVCPACLSAMIVSQLPAISAAALGAAGVKMAYDQKRSPKTREVRAVQPLRIHKVISQGNLQHINNLGIFLKCTGQSRVTFLQTSYVEA